MNHPSGIASQLLERLGAIVIEWSQAEACIGEVLARLLMADPGSMYVVTERVATSTQLDWIRALIGFRFADDETRANILALLDEINAIRGERNTLMHGLWDAGPQPDTAVVQTFKVDRRELLKGELITATELDDLLSEIRAVMPKLRLLVTALDNIKLVPGNANFES